MSVANNQRQQLLLQTIALDPIVCKSLSTAIHEPNSRSPHAMTLLLLLPLLRGHYDDDCHHYYNHCITVVPGVLIHEQSCIDEVDESVSIELTVKHHPSSIIHHPSSIIHHPSSIIHHPSSIIHQHAHTHNHDHDHHYHRRRHLHNHHCRHNHHHDHRHYDND